MTRLDRDTSVMGSHAEEVGGNQTVSVGGNRNLTTAATGVELVGLAASLKIGLAYSIQVGAASNLAVGGLRAVQVGGMRLEAVGEDRYEQVGKNASARVGGGFDVAVDGAVGLATGKNGKDDVGGSDGWSAETRAVEQAKELKLTADKFSLVVGGKKIVELTAQGVKIAGSKITVDGKAVKLKGSSIAKSSGAPPPSGRAKVRVLQAIKREGGSAKIRILGEDGAPMVGLRWRAQLSDGSLVEGTTDGEGSAAVPAKPGKPPKLSFPTLDADAWKVS